VRRAFLVLAFGVCCSAGNAKAEDFSVGGFALSGVIQETPKSGGQSWDDGANHRNWVVTKKEEEPVRRYAISVSAGKLGEPHAEHDIGVYTTDENRAFLMDFDNALDSAADTRARDFKEICAKDVEKLGGATRSIGTATPVPPVSWGHTTSIVLDRDMKPAARARTLAALDAWIARDRERAQRDEIRADDLTRSLRFKELAEVLGADFRGAIVSCGYIGGLEPIAVWETRFLDLPLAATVFNLNPE